MRRKFSASRPRNRDTSHFSFSAGAASKATNMSNESDKPNAQAPASTTFTFQPPSNVFKFNVGVGEKNTKAKVNRVEDSSMQNSAANFLPPPTQDQEKNMDEVPMDITPPRSNIDVSPKVDHSKIAEFESNLPSNHYSASNDSSVEQFAAPSFNVASVSTDFKTVDSSGPFNAPGPQFNIGVSEGIATSSKPKVQSPTSRLPLNQRRYRRVKRPSKTGKNNHNIELSSSTKHQPSSPFGNKASKPDYTGRLACVEAAKKEAGEHYAAARYLKSANSYTTAINAYKSGCNYEFAQKPDNALAILYSNRAAAFMMCGVAYNLAVSDGVKALSCMDISKIYEKPLKAEGGVQFAAKLQCRLARAYLKCGDTKNAESQFRGSIIKVDCALEKLSNHVSSRFHVDVSANRNLLQQTKTSGEIGLADVQRFNHLLEKADQEKCMHPDDSSKEFAIVIEGLSMAPGSALLWGRKIVLMKVLKRWNAIAFECEKASCDVAKLEEGGIFSFDLSGMNPFPHASSLEHLKPNLFDESSAEDKFLCTQATGEAVTRMPVDVRPLYLRALRLEERYDHVFAAIKTLESSRENYEKYVTEERDRVRRTNSAKAEGDNLFRTGKYDSAAIRYNVCLKIDSEKPGRLATSGGRLHAILHCNRAACLMATKRFREAAKECSAALRIHVSC